MSWTVREAKPKDSGEIVYLAKNYDEFLMPYVLNDVVVKGYIDQFVVATASPSSLEEAQVIGMPSLLSDVGGALHCIPNRPLPNNGDRVTCFLHYIKQVPIDIVEGFLNCEKKIAIIGQVVCPGKGSFYHILEYLKKEYDEIWCWMSTEGPSYKSYQRYGFNFLEERDFWNVYKCDYSRFVLGKWIKGGS